MLIDTDVLIDYLRGQDEAVAFLEAHHSELHVSAVTVAELYQGVREGRERTQLARTLSAMTVLPITAQIAKAAGLMRREHRAKLGCGLADCLIAATAEAHDLTMVTLNQNHFAMIKALTVPYTKR